MLSGFYTIASGLITRQRNVETIGNNLTNAQTPGFLSEKIVNSSFEMELMSRLSDAGETQLGDGIGAVAAVVGDSVTRFTPGSLKETGRSLDVAINGNGFFSVKGGDGKIYLTRSGAFDIDKDGYLIAPGIGKVQGQNGDIQIKTTNISIASDGTITNAAGASLGKISVSTPQDYQALTRESNGLFTADATANPLTASSSFQLVQNNLEMSNVDVNTELTNLIAAQRSLQSCATVLKTIDSLESKAASRIAAV